MGIFSSFWEVHTAEIVDYSRLWVWHPLRPGQNIELPPNRARSLSELHTFSVSLESLKLNPSFSTETVSVSLPLWKYFDSVTQSRSSEIQRTLKRTVFNGRTAALLQGPIHLWNQLDTSFGAQKICCSWIFGNVKISSLNIDSWRISLPICWINLSTLILFTIWEKEMGQSCITVSTIHWPQWILDCRKWIFQPNIDVDSV